MITRKQYMQNHSRQHDEHGSGQVAHNEYYAQFVNDDVLRIVKRSIGEDVIKASTDEHFNDIPLSRWDGTHGVAYATKEMRDAAGEGWSMSTNVCILKAAARQIRGW